MNYRKINNLTGWAVFAIATIVYIMTMEKSGSLWDCGEFAGVAHRMGIPHPPGAPLFVIIGRIFSFLGGLIGLSPIVSINLSSALSSSFTILFLFWTITHFARKSVQARGGQLDKQGVFGIMAAGVVGALAYTFSDSFWFSAVEAEVYAMSSLCTAVVFWAILKWEDHPGNTNDPANVNGRNQADKWLIFIFFIMGMSIGVHLLNLLTIPAIVVVYYFKRYKTTTKGFLLTMFISVLLLGFVQKIVGQHSISAGFVFERLFLNTFGLPVLTGFIFFFVALGALIWLGIRYAGRNNLGMLRLGLWCLAFTLIGMSTYLTTMIRSKANPGIDMYNVDNPYALKGYLGREQYGDFPLFRGQVYNATPVDVKQKGARYVLRKDENGKMKYINVGVDRENVYFKGDVVFFPRMWEVNDDNHKSFYRMWLGPKIEVTEMEYEPTEGGGAQLVAQRTAKIMERNGDEKPALFDNEEEAKNYADQLNQQATKAQQMVRYRVRDHINYGHNVRWFFEYQLNWMYFRYFMWNFAGKQNDVQGLSNSRDGNWISGISFIDNWRLGDQGKMPDSLKNNKANNKLYFLPLILGLIGMFYHLVAHKKDFTVNLLMFLMTGLAIVFYLNQWGAQPRERDYAYVGSFYAFAVWIGLGVLQVRDWLAKISGLSVANYAATAVCALAVPVLMAKVEWDDHDRGKKTLAANLAKDYLSSCPQNAILFTIGDNDTYPLWYLQEVEGYRTDVRVVNTSLLGIDWYMDQLRYAVNKSAPFKMVWKSSDYEGPKMEYATYQKYKNYDPNTVFPLDTMMLLALKQTEDNGNGDVNYFFPGRNCTVKVDHAMAAATKAFVLSPTDSALSIMPLSIAPNKNYLTKGDFGIFNVIAANISERAICFTDIRGDFSNLGFSNYLRRQGMVYQLIPAKSETMKKVETDNSYNLMMKEFAFGNAAQKGVYYDEENRRHLLSIRDAYIDAAKQLVADGKKAQAIELLQRVHKEMPSSTVPYGMASRYGQNNTTSINMAKVAFEAGDSALGNTIYKEVEKDVLQELRFFHGLANPGSKSDPKDVQQLINDMDTIDYLRQQASIMYQMGNVKEAQEIMKKRVEPLEEKVYNNRLAHTFNRQEFYFTMRNHDELRNVKRKFIEKAPEGTPPTEINPDVINNLPPVQPAQPPKKDSPRKNP